MNKLISSLLVSCAACVIPFTASAYSPEIEAFANDLNAQLSDSDGTIKYSYDGTDLILELGATSFFAPDTIEMIFSLSKDELATILYPALKEILHGDGAEFFDFLAQANTGFMLRLVDEGRNVGVKFDPASFLEK